MPTDSVAAHRDSESLKWRRSSVPVRAKTERTAAANAATVPEAAFPLGG